MEGIIMKTYVGYIETSGLETGIVEVTNTTEAIDSALASLKSQQSSNENVVEFFVASGISTSEYIIIAYVDP